MNFVEIIDSVESSILEWIRVRKHRLPLFILVVTMLFAFSHAPYINLFLNSYSIIFLSIVLSPLILEINAELFFAGALFLIIPALLLSLGEFNKEEAEIIGNFIFTLLSAGLMRLISSSDGD